MDYFPTVTLSVGDNIPDETWSKLITSTLCELINGATHFYKEDDARYNGKYN